MTSPARHGSSSAPAQAPGRRPGLNQRLARQWQRLGTAWLPFADVLEAGLPLPRLLRLALCQLSVGLASVLLVGTLNRVMIVELGVSSGLVALMVALPLLVAPLRALVGHRSDEHRSALGWRRVPYLWFGTLLQFGGLAIMPFSLILLSPQAAAEAQPGGVWVGHAAAALAFLMVGAGLQTVQTAGLALATDQAEPAARPRVVALMYLMLLLGMVLAGLLFSLVLRPFSPTRLVGLVQGVALVCVLCNLAALWKQESRRSGRGAPSVTLATSPEPAASAVSAGPRGFRDAWQRFAGQPRTLRFLLALGLGTAGFNMQDIVLEPYGAEILHLDVSATSLLSALSAAGAVCAFALAAQRLGRGGDAHRLAAAGALLGIAALSAVVFAAPLQSTLLFRIGSFLLGLGSGLFAVCTLVLAMGLQGSGNGPARPAVEAGLALGAWGAVQATCAGVAVGLGGVLHDGVRLLAQQGWLGVAMSEPQVAYSVVYHLEIALLFATLVVLGPLVRHPAAPHPPARHPQRLGLAEFPG